MAVGARAHRSQRFTRKVVCWPRSKQNKHVRVVSSSSCGFQATSAFDVQFHLLEEQCAAWRDLGADAFLAC